MRRTIMISILMTVSLAIGFEAIRYFEINSDISFMIGYIIGVIACFSIVFISFWRIR